MQAPHFGAFNRFIDPLRDAGFPTPEALARVPDSPFKRAYLPKEGVTTWLEEICDVATGEMCLPVDGTKCALFRKKLHWFPNTGENCVALCYYHCNYVCYRIRHS